MEPKQFAYGGRIKHAIIHLLQDAVFHLYKVGITVRITVFYVFSTLNTMYLFSVTWKSPENKSRCQSDGLYLTERSQFKTQVKCLRKWSTRALEMVRNGGTVLSQFFFALYTSDFQYNGSGNTQMTQLWSVSVVLRRLSEGNWLTALWHCVGAAAQFWIWRLQRSRCISGAAISKSILWHGRRGEGGKRLQILGCLPGQETQLEMQDTEAVYRRGQQRLDFFQKSLGFNAGSKMLKYSLYNILISRLYKVLTVCFPFTCSCT